MYNLTMRALVLILFITLFQNVFSGVNYRDVKCLVCHTAIKEIIKPVNAINPNENVDAGGYSLDASGNIKTKMVSKRKSEMYIAEILEKICDKMDDYVRAVRKDTGELTLIKLVGEDGKMDASVSEVDFVQDGDLNKSLKHYCVEFINEHEEVIIEKLVNDDISVDDLCTVTKFCSEDIIKEDL